MSELESQPPDPESKTPWNRFFTDFDRLIKQETTRDERIAKRMGTRSLNKKMENSRDSYKYTFREITTNPSLRRYQLSVKRGKYIRHGQDLQRYEETDKVTMHDLGAPDLIVRGYDVVLEMSGISDVAVEGKRVYATSGPRDDRKYMELYGGPGSPTPPADVLNGLYSIISQTIINGAPDKNVNIQA